MLPFRSICTSIILMLMSLNAFGEYALSVPGLQTELNKIQRIGYLEPQLKLYEVFPGGLIEERQSWGVEAKKNTQKALAAYFSQTPFKVEKVPSTLANNPDAKQIFTLYNRICLTINNGVANPMGLFSMPGKAQEFDYELGNVQALFEGTDKDAMLLINGFDYYMSTSNKVSVAAQSLLSFGISLAAMDRPYGNMNVSLVDRQGRILWYGSMTSELSDLRDYNINQQMLEVILNSYPGAKK